MNMLLATVFMVFGFGTAFYFFAAGAECVTFLDMTKNCYGTFHIGTAIFIGAIAIGVLGCAIAALEDGRK